MQELFVDTPEALTQLCQQLQGSEWLALDTEFIREKTYYPKLCLVQVSNGEVAACVDPIALKDIQPLLDVLFNGTILKVFHAARQDVEIFLHDWHKLPLPIFDTQPAASLLGHGDQIGYARLVQQVLDIDLAKDQSRTDWSRRPLTDSQKRYALDDVIYLGQLYLKMRGSLSDKKRLQWLAADFAELANPATYSPDPSITWKRVKGKQHLRGRQLAILQALSAWREVQARERDLPKKWLLKDDLLVELCRRIPNDTGSLSRVRGMDAGMIRREGESLLELISKAAALPKEQWPQDKRRPRPLTHQQEAQADYLNAALRLIADQNQLSPQAIATHKDIEKLIRGDSECSLLEGWRHALAGTQLEALLKGELRLSLEQGRLAIRDA